MRAISYRLVGIILVIGSLLGGGLTITGLVYLWQTKTEVTQQVTNTADLFNRSLLTTSEGLLTVESTLDNAKTELSLMRESLDSVSDSLRQTHPMIVSTADLVGVEMPEVIINTRRSLLAAENSAKLVDDTLRIVSRIPLVGGRYTPDVPLQTSIAQVSDSLEGLPASFYNLRKGMLDSASQVLTIQGTMAVLADEMSNIDTRLEEAQVVNNQYREIVVELTEQSDRLQDRLPRWLENTYRVATMVLIWLIITQIAIFTQGIDWLTKPV